MLIGHLAHPNTYQSLLSHQPWPEIFNWLQKEAPAKDDGEYELDGQQVFAIIQTLTTRPRSAGVFEAHKLYRDLHYCLAGEEVIEWAPADTLTPKGEFNSAQDYGHYEVPNQTVKTHFTPGLFGLYFPADAHMPQVAATEPNSLRKVVVKIKLDPISQ